MTKRKSKTKKSVEMPGWLVVVLILFIFSVLNAIYLLVQRLYWIFNLPVGKGVYVSMILLLIYSVLMWYSIYLILKRKKKAIKISIIALCFGLIFVLWFYLIGRIIFDIFTRLTIIYGTINFLFNLIIAVLIISYLKKSGRVKNYFK